MILDLESAGEGVPVLAVPPFPFDHDVYRPQLDAAAVGELPCRLLAVKPPGFGGSPWPAAHPPILRVEDMAAGLVALTRTLGLDRPVLVGAGLGGYAVLQALGTAPGSFRAALVMSCKPAGDAAGNRPQRAEAARVALDRGAEAAADLFAVASLSPVQREPRQRAARAMVQRADPHALAAAVWGIHLRPDPRGVLERIRVPVVVASGADDLVCPPDDARALAALLPRAHFRELDDCGHAPPLERPDAVTDLICGLLTDAASLTAPT